VTEQLSIESKMTENQEKAIQYLEAFQEQSLVERFGKDYLSKYNDVLGLTKKTDFLNAYFNSQLNMTDEEKADFTKSYDSSLKSCIIKTKYELPESILILSSLFDKIDVAATRLTYQLNKKPFIGTAFSKEFNAFAARVPGTEESLLVFESELFTLCNLLAKIIASCLPDFKIDESGVSFKRKKIRIKNHIDTNPLIKERFKDFVINAVINGLPNGTRQYFLSETVSKLQYELLSSIELFIVGHEYGHIYAGHIDKALVKTRMINNEQLEFISPDWQMEFEADFYGLSLLVNTDSAHSFLPFSLLGPELFFTFLDIFERANTLVALGTEIHSNGGNTHPPTIERRKKIRELLGESIPERLLDSYQVVSEFLENVMEVLWADFNHAHIRNGN
jgi:hypothetical protein